MTNQAHERLSIRTLFAPTEAIENGHMRTPPTAQTPTSSAPRWALWGFIAGAVITMPATMFALLSPTGEALMPYLVPGAPLLQPLADMMAVWPGLLNMTLVSVANGLVYGALAGAVAMVLGRLRRR